MPNNKDEEAKATSNIVSKFRSFYLKPNLRAFGTYEEMNEADAKEMAAFSPAEHLQHATALITKLYKEELKKPMDKKIRFR